ncbi:Rz1-like lysis system protein LysC [Proteus alimentorum]|uniref:Rz1-like lysis system protein LysC n=1 Tax=Proteus alimentorum TaxID=1973495 RepID=UPI00101AD3F6
MSLCLTLLSSCSKTPSTPVITADKFVPSHLLQPCSVPFFNVQVWGDYPDYVARLLLVLEKCNTDKKAIAEILAVKNQRNSNELDHKKKIN